MRIAEVVIHSYRSSCITRSAPASCPRRYEAVRSGLRSVKLKNVKDKSAMQIAFQDGILEMHCAYALRTDGMFSDNEIRAMLEKSL